MNWEFVMDTSDCSVLRRLFVLTHDSFCITLLNNLLVLRKTRSLLQSDRFRKDFRSEMLKRHVTLIDLAEGILALRADDCPRDVRLGRTAPVGHQIPQCVDGRKPVPAKATGDVPGA